ncbi:MAG: FkbM family methyltransferase [Robiginitomaculum sp.]|nr:FkbM family methyltransferase [Robiginitomaculum sp.]
MILPARIIRDLQSRFGYLLDAKYGAQRFVRKLRKTPFESEFAILKHLSPNGRSFVDAGANRGQSIDALRLYRPGAQIFSFEPNKALFDKLVSRFKNDKNLELNNMGLGKAKLSADLFVPYYRKFMYDGLSSFTQERATNWLNEDTVWRFNPKFLSVERQTCKIDVLDQFSLAPFFLKIHVQGFELEVLEGSAKTIKTHRPVILIAKNKAADRWLRSKGWEEFAFIDNKLIEASNEVVNVYNCLYFHPQSKEHCKIIKDLS